MKLFILKAGYGYRLNGVDDAIDKIKIIGSFDTIEQAEGRYGTEVLQHGYQWGQITNMVTNKVKNLVS